MLERDLLGKGFFVFISSHNNYLFEIKTMTLRSSFSYFSPLAQFMLERD
jgi:hypothetical protein